MAPSFKLGPAGGAVRPRIARSTERERSFLALSLGDPNQMWDLSIDKDSDVDKSVTAGTEEHSSFSEQAWDFYQVNNKEILFLFTIIFLLKVKLVGSSALLRSNHLRNHKLFFYFSLFCLLYEYFRATKKTK